MAFDGHCWHNIDISAVLIDIITTYFWLLTTALFIVIAQYDLSYNEKKNLKNLPIDKIRNLAKIRNTLEKATVPSYAPLYIYIDRYINRFRNTLFRKDPANKLYVSHFLYKDSKLFYNIFVAQSYIEEEKITNKSVCLKKYFL